MSQWRETAAGYVDLEYLACLSDPSSVDEVTNRLQSAGIPVRVQSVSVRAKGEPENCRFRLFVPHDEIEPARSVALDGIET
jgi:hypothetical protein